MDYIRINGKVIPYPNDFTMKKVPNVVAQLRTLSGKDVADINGWKYEPTTLQWDTLLDQDLRNLLDAISDNVFEIQFSDIDGEHTVEAILESRVSTKTPMKENGAIVWKEVNVELSFPDCYH